MPTPSYKSQISAMISDHPTIAEMNGIAKTIGCSPKTVRYCASKFGLLSKKKLPPVDEVIRDLQDGKPPRTIAKRYRVTKSAVYRHLIRHGYQLRRGVVFKLTTTNNSPERISA